MTQFSPVPHKGNPAVVSEKVFFPVGESSLATDLLLPLHVVIMPEIVRPLDNEDKINMLTC